MANISPKRYEKGQVGTPSRLYISAIVQRALSLIQAGRLVEDRVFNENGKLEKKNIRGSHKSFTSH